MKNSDKNFDFYSTRLWNHLNTVRWRSAMKMKSDLTKLCQVRLRDLHCVKSVLIRSYFCSVFSCIRTEYRKIWTRNNSVFGHISRSISASGSNFKLNFSVEKHNEFALTRSLIKSNCTSGSTWLRTSDAVKADGKRSLSIKMEKLLQKYQLYHPLI